MKQHSGASTHNTGPPPGLCFVPVTRAFSFSFIFITKPIPDFQSAYRQCATPTDKQVRRILNKLFLKCLPSKPNSQSATVDS